MKRSASADRFHTCAGFSMVELGIVVMFIILVSGFALLNIQGIMPGMRTDAAWNQTLAQLRDGRELAIAQRRNIELRFVGNNQIQLVRFDVPAGRTVLSDVTLENKVEFHLFDGLPDTPDLFGNGSAIDFGGANTLIFLSDGTLVDAQGDPANGTVFLGLPGRVETARAVTLLGATGRVRGYRWTRTKWIK